MGFLLAHSTVSIAKAPNRELKEYTLPELVSHFASQYNVSPTQLMNVMRCESNYRQDSWGDGNRARGVFQYWQGTWDDFSKEFGEKLDIESAYDQIKLTAWAFSKNKQSHWTCARTLGYVK